MLPGLRCVALRGCASCGIAWYSSGNSHEHRVHPRHHAGGRVGSFDLFRRRCPSIFLPQKHPVASAVYSILPLPLLDRDKREQLERLNVCGRERAIRPGVQP